MEYNHGLERKKFDAEQKRLREIYEKSGMSESDIEAMYKFDEIFLTAKDGLKLMYSHQSRKAITLTKMISKKVHYTKSLQNVCQQQTMTQLNIQDTGGLKSLIILLWSVR